MDPASAIGIAAASLQFLEFGIKITKSTKEILGSASGLTARQDRLRQVADRLQDLATQQTKDIERFGQGRNATEADQELRKICIECQDRAAAMLEAVGGLAATPKGMVLEKKALKGAFGSAVKAHFNEGKNKELMKELEDSRTQLHTALLVSLCERSSTSLEGISELQRGMASVLSEIRKGQDSEVPGITQESMSVKLRISTANANSPVDILQRKIIDRIWDKRWKANAENDADDTEARGKLSLAANVADSLPFKDFKRREEMIPEAYNDTLQWIWQQHPPMEAGKQRWSSLPDWLRDPANTVYWVTGKPGSGKSTLMKHIQSHPDLQSHLEDWASNSVTGSTMIASFYAWYAGSDEQKSIDGLRRTILEHVLREEPRLIAQIMPRRWALWKCFPGCLPSVDWLSWELEESLSLFLQACERGNGRRMFLMIDGLDEFSVPPKEIAGYISAISRAGLIKICVASRPWPAFRDTFGSSPQLAMHQLSAEGIRAYVGDKLSECQAFHERPGPEAARLQDAVLESANGVFLWVSTVTKFLVQSLENGDTTDELEKIVRTLPDEMSDLYDIIWMRVREPSKAARIVLLKEACVRQEMHFMTLWIVDEQPSSKKMQAEDVDGIRKTVVRRLHSRTYGLLEVLPDGTVDYLHRTAFEWTRKRVLQSSALDPESQLDHTLMKGYGQLGARSPAPNRKFVGFGGKPSWYEYLTMNFLFHATKVASWQAEAKAAERDEFASGVCDFIALADLWQSKLGKPREEDTSSSMMRIVWLGDVEKNATLVYEVAALLGLMPVFDRLPASKWEWLQRRQSPRKSLWFYAACPPNDEMMYSWGMGIGTYVNMGLLRPEDKLRLARMFLERGLWPQEKQIYMKSIEEVRSIANVFGGRTGNTVAAAYLKEAAAELERFASGKDAESLFKALVGGVMRKRVVLWGKERLARVKERRVKG